RGIVDYLYHLYIPAPRSAFAAIAKLPPGHLLRYRDASPSVTCYWRPRFRPVARSTEEHVDGLRARFLDSVRSRLVADVPVAAFLSGGIDSTSVVAAISCVRERPIHTFTITFEGYEHYDEAPAARLAARQFGTEHHEIS